MKKLLISQRLSLSFILRSRRAGRKEAAANLESRICADEGIKDETTWSR